MKKLLAAQNIQRIIQQFAAQNTIEETLKKIMQKFVAKNTT